MWQNELKNLRVRTIDAYQKSGSINLDIRGDGYVMSVTGDYAERKRSPYLNSKISF